MGGEVPSSRMEWEVYKALKVKGVKAEFQRSFCVMSTTPDIYFPEKRLAIYIDGVQVHVKRQEKDETLRELLAKRYGVKVLSIPYERYSKRELERIVNTIMEELRDENSENLSKLRKNVQYFPLRGKASR